MSARLLQSIVVVCVFLLSVASSSRAQGAGIVPPDDHVYADLDRLAELGVLTGVIVGQRPYSRRELARITVAVRARLDGPSRPRLSDDASNMVEDLLRRMESRFTEVPSALREAVTLVPLEGLLLSYQSTDAIRRHFPAPYSFPVEATIDPLADRRLGLPSLRGEDIALELAHRLDFSDWLSIQARERLSSRHPRDTTESRRNGELLLASLRARAGNAAITVGRQQFAWAQREGSGLFIASDAPALDAVAISNDHPFRLPGFLSALGPASATLVAADLGASVARSHSKLVTYKFSVSPSNDVEVGGTFMDHFGGKGGRSSSATNEFIDFLPFIDIFRTHNYRDSSRALDVDSDKLLGVDGRVRLARLGGVILAGEILIDDFDVHRIPKLLTGYGSQTFSLVIPQLNSPYLSAELTAKHLGIITYTHSELTNGIATRGRLIGDELGPDAKSYSAKLRYTPFASARVELEGRSSIYSNASYSGAYTNPSSTTYEVRKLSHTSDELREMILASLTLQSDDGIALTLRGGGERTRNAFFGGGRRRDYVAEAAVRVFQ